MPRIKIFDDEGTSAYFIARESDQGWRNWPSRVSYEVDEATLERWGKVYAEYFQVNAEISDMIEEERNRH
jgi:hypothetical protein